jgi:ribosomal protein L37AE/L43A
MNCPFCSRRLDRVTINEDAIYCCPNCSVAWRAGLRNSTAIPGTTESTTALRCPGCGDQPLRRASTTAEAAEWQCTKCHGQLLQLAAQASPERKQESPTGGHAAGSAVEFMAEVAETIFGSAT